MAASPSEGDAVPLPAIWEALGWCPGDDQLAAFCALQVELRRWNGRLNLTRLVEGDDYWIAQVLDSLWPLAELLQQDPGVKIDVIDVGTGGGFPGLAVAIALPSARLTLVDSVGRKVEAVRAMAAALGLGGRVQLRCERIERSGRAPECRGCFDLAMARAVASAPVVAEYLVPLLRPRGSALLYRGQWSGADENQLLRALGPLRARLEEVRRFVLPAERGIRHALLLRPEGPCPDRFPRAVGIPAKQPIGASAT